MALPAEEEFNFVAFEPAERRKEAEKKNKAPNIRRQSEDKAYQSAQRKSSTLKTFKLVGAFSVIVVLAFINLYAYSVSDIADRKYDSLYEEYKMAVSDNQRLSMELNSMISLEQIEKTAVEQLGLVKLDPSEIEYVRISTGNKVVVSSGSKTN